MSINEKARENWSLYLIRAGDGSLYTGISTDVSRRFDEHQNSDKKDKGAKALRGKAPLSLVYQIVAGSRSEALKLEYKIKQLNKNRKEKLIDLRVDSGGLKTWLLNNQVQKHRTRKD